MLARREEGATDRPTITYQLQPVEPAQIVVAEFDAPAKSSHSLCHALELLGTLGLVGAEVEHFAQPGLHIPCIRHDK